MVAGSRAGPVKCIKWFQVCGKRRLRVWLLTTCIPWQAKDALCISLPPILPAPGTLSNNFDEEDAEHQYEEDLRVVMRWESVLCIRAWTP